MFLIRLMICCLLSSQAFAGNFTRATDTHIQVAHRTYESQGGKTIRLLGVFHVASLEFFAALNEKLSSAQVVLYEGINAPFTSLQKINAELKRLLSGENYEIYHLIDEFEPTSQGMILKGFPSMAGVLQQACQVDSVSYVRDDVPSPPIFIHADHVEAGFKSRLMTLLNALKGDKKEEMAQLFLQDHIWLVQKLFAERGVEVNIDEPQIVLKELHRLKQQDIAKMASSVALSGDARREMLKSRLLPTHVASASRLQRDSILKNKIDEHFLFDPDIKNADVLFGVGHFEGEAGLEAYLFSRGFTMVEEEWVNVLPLD